VEKACPPIEAVRPGKGDSHMTRFLLWLAIIVIGVIITCQFLPDSTFCEFIGGLF